MAGQGFPRRLQLLCFLALRVLRHHYFSFLTAGVLAAIAVVAMRSTSFEQRALTAGETTAREAIDWAPVEKKSFATRGRSLIYYIVDSQEQASAIHRAIRSDMVMSEQNGGRYDFGLVYFVQAGTPMEEGNVARLLNTVVEGATGSGSVVTIIDVRQ
jgi:hypothetical protein